VNALKKKAHDSSEENARDVLAGHSCKHTPQYKRENKAKLQDLAFVVGPFTISHSKESIIYEKQDQRQDCKREMDKVGRWPRLPSFLPFSSHG
jgi:hypothetical protein